MIKEKRERQRKRDRDRGRERRIENIERTRKKRRME
jgi:hypothetical protein